MTIPDCVFLQPECCYDPCSGQQWSTHDLWGDDCLNHSPAAMYVPVEEWRKIPEPSLAAPHDGEPVLIWKGDERMVGEYMMAAYWAEADSGEAGFVPVGGHHKQGYFSSVTNTDQGYPTHWKPLPAPPRV